MKIQKYFSRSEDSIESVIRLIDSNKDGIVLVVDQYGVLVGSITDGDIRRYMLSNGDITQACSVVMNPKPITARKETSRQELIKFFRLYRIRSIPLVDRKNCPLKIINYRDLFQEVDFETRAVIMAGGEGKRLRPITNKIPKPMIRIGGQPVIEQIIRNLKNANIRDIYISVNYCAEIIEKYFKDGSDYGVSIRYLREEKKLGTAGALSMLDDLPPCKLVVMNGDVMTKIKFGRLVEFHSQQRCVLTVAAINYHLNIPYAVLDIAGPFVLGLEEKPSKQFLCNAGIYVLNSDLTHLVPNDSYYDMTDLMSAIIERGLPMATFPIHEFWIDIGKKEDLEKATQNSSKLRNTVDRGA